MGTLFLFVVCTVIQLYLLREIKHVVDAKAVHDIREAYDAFEEIMYDDHVLTPNGKHRGLGPIKDASTFYDDDLLDQGTRASICAIPLSQPMFVFVVLLIWTLTCMKQFRKALEIFNAVIVGLPTYPDMKAALQTCEEDETDNVMGLTLGVKSAIVVLVIIPQVCITAVLLWLGCRWLLATSDFPCLILNAVALEFVLCLKDLIYNALVPPRSMHDLARTLINTKRRQQTTTSLSCAHLLGASLRFHGSSSTWAYQMSSKAHSRFCQVTSGTCMSSASRGWPGASVCRSRVLPQPTTRIWAPAAECSEKSPLGKTGDVSENDYPDSASRSLSSLRCLTPMSCYSPGSADEVFEQCAFEHLYRHIL